jgi:glycosyltransferase involved in cell wall biosynthesis
MPVGDRAAQTQSCQADGRTAAYFADVGNAYSVADIFVFPSLEEGSPLVTHEAMTHGLPLLVFSNGCWGLFGTKSMAS